MEPRVGNREKLKELDAFVTKTDGEIGAYRIFDPPRGLEASSPEGPLLGRLFAVQDDVAVRGWPLSCGSRMLKNFISPYTAPVVERLQALGAVLTGVTVMNEFGLAVTGEGEPIRSLGPAKNPWDGETSLSGAAAAVASEMAQCALTSDISGGMLLSAAASGLFGFRPGRGVLSRHGFAVARPSLDGPGLLSSSLSETREVFRFIRGEDQNPEEGDLEKTGRPWRLGLISGDESLQEPPVAEALGKAAAGFQDRGWELRDLALPRGDYWEPVYQALAAAELSSSLARYDGLRYGFQGTDAESPEKLVRRSRREGFGRELGLQILLGTHILRASQRKRYYNKAQKLRSAISADFAGIFQEVDLLLMPIFLEASQGGRAGRAHHLAPALTGLPALSVPVGQFRGLPLGLLLIAPSLGEERLLKGAEVCAEEQSLPARSGRGNR